ncbi:MAG TPA: UV DNA damage repair endonuclease UvsE [Bryobacteraceae bacterium]|nr:UV DNA damage repair endonuclease UvsE [Bryobacteraceae bacterium]
MPAEPSLRLGFPVKVLGQKGLKSNDSRRWQSNPHLSVSLGYLREIFAYLKKRSVHMYRMSSDLAPYVTHPDMPQFHNQIRECRDELREIGRMAQDLDIRLSFHPSQYVIINTPDLELRRKSVADLLAQSEMLDAMELGPEAVVVTHGGGTYGDPEAGMSRWVEAWRELPEPVCRRLVLENDDLRYSASQVLSIHERTGVRLIFDVQHFWCLNTEGLELRSTFLKFLDTWETSARPKMHFSSPRTEMREVQRKDRKTGKKITVLLPPLWTGHADFNHPFEFISFMRIMHDRNFDVMLEAKAKDLGLLRLRQDLLRYAPDVAARFGLTPAAAAPEEEEMEISPDALGELDG